MIPTAIQPDFVVYEQRQTDEDPHKRQTEKGRQTGKIYFDAEGKTGKMKELHINRHKWRFKHTQTYNEA